MKFNESLTDLCVNSLLYLKSQWRSLASNSELGTDEPRTDEMKLVFHDDFKSLDPSKWRIGQPWGVYHPEFPNQYYGFDSVRIDDGDLALNQWYSPKTFNANGEVYIEQSVGLVTSYQTFGYGFYEFEVKLPYGMGLWPAVWLTAADSWPPEIDILEAYSDERCEYGPRLQSNLHFGTTPNNEAAGARNHPMFDYYRSLKLSCWFTEDFIKIYYSGYLVRSITSEKILRWFRDKKYMLVLNNGVRPGFEPRLQEQYSEFLINSVKIWQQA